MRVSIDAENVVLQPGAVLALSQAGEGGWLDWSLEQPSGVRVEHTCVAEIIGDEWVCAVDVATFLAEPVPGDEFEAGILLSSGWNVSVRWKIDDHGESVRYVIPSKYLRRQEDTPLAARTLTASIAGAKSNAKTPLRWQLVPIGLEGPEGSQSSGVVSLSWGQVNFRPIPGLSRSHKLSARGTAVQFDGLVVGGEYGLMVWDENEHWMGKAHVGGIQTNVVVQLHKVQWYRATLVNAQTGDALVDSVVRVSPTFGRPYVPGEPVDDLFIGHQALKGARIVRES